MHRKVKAAAWWLVLGLLVLLVLLAGNAAAETVCTEDSCSIPALSAQGEPVYGIVSPVGYHDVEMISQPARPDTLDGKVIALVGGSFMADTTMPVLKACILDEYPAATVYLPAEVGNAGPFSVGGQTAKTRAFQQKLRDLKVDIVIAGNCGCGLCTMKETGSAIAAEYIGIPSVTIGAPGFIAQIHSTGVNRGVSVLRSAEYPGAFSAHTAEELKENTRSIVWPLVKEALLTPITDAEIALYANAGELPYDQIIFDGTYDEVQEFCLASGWTDGLPVVPPTQEKVQEYLRYCAYEASDVVGTIPPSYRRTFAYTVAANAVMAGVPREFMPICMAFAECMEDGEWRRPLASTHGWSPYAWLNGPLARQLGIDCGQGMISEAKNRALGRFIDLCMLNLGGYYVKENRMGTFGYLPAWTFSEDDAACLNIGWQPYHVEQGYDLNANTLTAASALTWGNNVTPATSDPEEIMTLLAWDITEKQQNGLGNTNPQVYRTVFITEYVARDLAARYASKSALEDALIAAARRPLYMRAYAAYYANTGSQQTDKYTFRQYYGMLKRDKDEQAALTAVPPWLSEVTDETEIWTIATMNKGQTPLLVTGDKDRNKFQVMPGGGYVTTEIRLPDRWDELVAPLGYAPLESFYLTAPDVTAQAEAPQGMRVPAAFAAGDFRLVASKRLVKGEGRICLDRSGKLYVWDGTQAAEVTLGTDGSDLLTLLAALTTNCSVHMDDGRVTAVTLRLPTGDNAKAADLSGLSALDLSGVEVSLAITLRQSAENGSATPTGAEMLLPSCLEKIGIDLGGQLTLVSDEGLLTLEGSGVVLNHEAAAGTGAKVGVQGTDGSWRTLTFIMKEACVQVTYNAAERAAEK